MEGGKSHGAGHRFYSEEYLESLKPFEEKPGLTFPRFEGEKDPVKVEQAFYESLLTIRNAFENNPALTRQLADWIVNARQRLADAPRRCATMLRSSKNCTRMARYLPSNVPRHCTYEVGSKQTLRGALVNA